MAVLLSDFIVFPGAEVYPAGPYDLESISYSTAENGSFQLSVQLGWVYDFYLLEIIADRAVSWELWHDDSAVVHVDPRKLVQNPIFSYKEISIPCNFPLSIEIMHGKLEGRAVRLSFRTPSSHSKFAIEFELESGPTICLTDGGWRMIHDVPSDDSWPSDEWKDWNTS